MICNRCGKEYNQGLRMCPFCGAGNPEINNAAPQPTAQPQPIPGAPYPGGAYAMPVPQKKKSHAKILIPVIILVVALLVTTISVIAYYSSDTVAISGGGYVSDVDYTNYTITVDGVEYDCSHSVIKIFYDYENYSDLPDSMHRQIIDFSIIKEGCYVTIGMTNWEKHKEKSGKTTASQIEVDEFLSASGKRSLKYYGKLPD